MTGKEMALIGQLLSDYADQLSHANCNDWDFPDDWTNEERVEFVRSYHEWNGDPEEFDKDNPFLGDFEVAAFLASKLK